MSVPKRVLPIITVIVFAGCQDRLVEPRPVERSPSLSSAATLPLTSWQPLSPAGTPMSARYLHTQTAYDEVNDRLMFFGGYDDLNRNDSWVLANASGTHGTPTWIQLTPVGSPPFVRNAHAVVYDPNSNRLIVHGGCDGCSPVRSDTWVLTNANGLGGTPAWITLPSAPVGRAGHVAVYDPDANRMIVFGGHDGYYGTTRNDTWMLVDANGIGSPHWLPVSPIGSPPARRDVPAVFYDRLTDRMVIFGGQQFASATSGISFNDLWVLENATGVSGPAKWVQLSPAGGPPSVRASAVMGYDAANNRAVLFGGIQELPSPTTYRGDSWLLSNANGVGTPEWTLLSPTGPAPSARYRHAGAFSPAANGLITLYGARLGGYANDVWLLKLVDEIEVAIDVKPGSTDNSINPRNRGVIPVAVLTTAAFNAASVQVPTVRFGANGTEATPVHNAAEDVDGDGDVDLVMHFRTEQTGIACGATIARLSGKSLDGRSLRGADAISTTGCR